MASTKYYLQYSCIYKIKELCSNNLRFLNMYFINRPVLPKATSLLGKRKLMPVDDQITDDPSFHQGRIRSFKHERGNWATYVYISASLNLLEEIQDACLTHLPDKCELKAPADLHISLSKTVVLQYHFIESFVKNLEDVLTGVSRLSVSFSELNVYANAERTRTFIAIKVDGVHLNQMLAVLTKIDSVMDNFRLSTFYEHPSFHISVLWCVGDHVDLINNHLPVITKSVKEILPIELKIDKIGCKIGFKEYQFQLK